MPPMTRQHDSKSEVQSQIPVDHLSDIVRVGKGEVARERAAQCDVAKRRAIAVGQKVPCIPVKYPEIADRSSIAPLPSAGPIDKCVRL